MALQEDERTNKWKKQDICIGSSNACAFPGLISSYSKFIISFAEDEAGNTHCCFYSTFLRSRILYPERREEVKYLRAFAILGK